MAKKNKGERASPRITERQVLTGVLSLLSLAIVIIGWFVSDKLSRLEDGLDSVERVTTDLRVDFARAHPGYRAAATAIFAPDVVEQNLTGEEIGQAMFILADPTIDTAKIDRSLLEQRLSKIESLTDLQRQIISTSYIDAIADMPNWSEDDSHWAAKRGPIDSIDGVSFLTRTENLLLLGLLFLISIGLVWFAFGIDEADES